MTAQSTATTTTRTREVLHSSASVEWFTPEPIIALARLVLGGIDLDPASCAEANQTVRARRYYTRDDDGLRQPWQGRVWLNPPYGRNQRGASNQGVWSRRLCLEYEQGHVAGAILLVDAAVGASWFTALRPCWLCLLDQRLDFWRPATSSGAASRSGRGGAAAGDASRPTHGNALVYFGPEPERFAAAFRPLGRICPPDPAETTAAPGGFVAWLV